VDPDQGAGGEEAGALDYRLPTGKPANCQKLKN
jgi:hypothetical protein